MVKRRCKECKKIFYRIYSRSWASKPGDYGKNPVKFCSSICANNALKRFWNSSPEKKRRSKRQEGRMNSHWKNGCRDVMGYVWVYHPKHHLHKIKNAIPRAVDVVERVLGRRLAKAEIVHHIDGNKKNDHPSNLMVFKNSSEHMRWHGKRKDMRPVWTGHKQYWKRRAQNG